MASPACHKPPALPRIGGQRPQPQYSSLFPAAQQPDLLPCSTFSCSFAISPHFAFAGGAAFRTVLDALPDAAAPAIAASSPADCSPPAVQDCGSTEICNSFSSSSGFSSPSSSDNEEDDSCSSSTSLQLAFGIRPTEEGPLDSLSSLCAALPIKRGLSRYFSGKSQSFSSLARVSSVSQLAKPKNRYAKRRRTAFLGAGSMLNLHSYPPPCPPAAYGTSKKLAAHNRYDSLKSTPCTNEGPSTEGLAKSFSVPDF